MKYFLAILLIVYLPDFSAAQINFVMDHPISISQDDSFIFNKSNNVTKIETVYVIAVMVDFVEDADERTSGNGKFDLSPHDTIIDSPPHNKEYFEHHLKFLQNYWSKVTNNRLIIQFNLLDSVYHLPNQMKYYSPPKKSTNFIEIGYLIWDTWRLVDSLNPGFPFQNYNAFIIFHAGVGRDVDLTSIYGYDPTPYDIPSLYMGLNSLKSIFGNDFEGIPVNGGKFLINNSLIIPETENRKISTVGGSTLLQLGINGIMVGTFGSYLGLPDLFNTKTGRTAIGRFGLMDGQSMFSWNGIFPPELSAWEKYFLEKKYNLGFLNVIEVLPGEQILNIPAVSSLNTVDTIYKIPINTKEYYLVENRNRDANRDGCTITMIFKGDTIKKYYSRDTIDFNYLNQGSLYGSIIDIDELDWSLPGGVTKDGNFFDGGILIWHVDESVIEDNLLTNTINANSNRRGVDLEEADGSQDLGQSYGFLSPGSGSEDGTSLDFWFNGNSAPLYRNEFSYWTNPSSLSNDMAFSHVTINDFSERSPRMQFNVILGNDVIKPLPGFPKYIGIGAINQSPQVIEGKIFVSNGDSIFAFLSDGRSATKNINGLFAPCGGKFPVTPSPITSSGYFYGIGDSSYFIFQAIDDNNDGIYDSINTLRKESFNGILSTPVSVLIDISKPDESVNFFGDVNGNIYLFPSAVSHKISDSRILSVSVGPAHFLCSSNDSLHKFDAGFALPVVSDGWEVFVAASTQSHPIFFVAADVGGNYVLIIDTTFNNYKVITINDGKIAGVAIGDVDKDGSRDIVVTAGRKIYAYNRNGIMLDYFPISLSDTVSNSPIICDINGDEIIDILACTVNNLIVAYSAKGKSIFGFPISISGGSIASMNVTYVNENSPGILTAISSDGYLYAWSLTNVKNFIWSNYRGDVFHSAFERSVLTGSLRSEFFPTSRAYNWPNPVYENKTNIRFYVNESSIVTIKIFDISGNLVEEIKTSGIGGLDNEVEWNVSNLQSGIYYAHIKAESASKEGSAIIKIAVVK